jgi:glycine cleavage system protein P-like pyridoxal-binding family
MSESDDIFKKMLDKDELPAYLTERYRKLSILTERMSEKISVTDMAKIALDCGFNPDTMEFLNVSDGHTDKMFIDTVPLV